MTASDFRNLAARCRRAARDCFDLFAKEEFRRLAQEFDGQADELDLVATHHVNGTLNLTLACRYRHFESDPSASSLVPRSREQCGQMLSSLSFALLGRARMPARRLSLSR
jgi:hypothetical protein